VNYLTNTGRCLRFRITRKTLCHQINKKLKKLFSKVLALRALFCHCQEYGRKYSFTIFLPTSTHILTNIKTFKKQKHEKRYTPWFYCTLKYNPYFFVFAFTDFIAWNATVGVDGEWRKLVNRQSPSMPNGHLEKIEISKRIFIVFFENEDTGLYWCAVYEK